MAPTKTLQAQVSRVETSGASTTKLSRRRSRRRTAATTWKNCRLRRSLETRRATSTTWLSRNHRSLSEGRLETRRASSTTWLSRNHGTLSEEGLEPRHRDGVLLVANCQAEKCAGSVNHPVWAVIQGREGWTSPITRTNTYSASQSAGGPKAGEAGDPCPSRWSTAVHGRWRGASERHESEG